jgi:hypothetical protein
MGLCSQTRDQNHFSSLSLSTTRTMPKKQILSCDLCTVSVFHVVCHWNGRDSLFVFFLCSITGDPTWNTVINLCDSLVKKVDIVICCVILCIYCILSVSVAYLRVLLRMVCHSPIAVPSLPLVSDHCSHSPASASHCPCSVMLASGCLVSLPIYWLVLMMPVKYLWPRHYLFAIMNND